MAAVKVTITLDLSQVEEIRALVTAGEAASVSGFVKNAVGIALHDAAGWREMLAGWREILKDALAKTGGPLTKKEKAWADALLAGPRTKNGAGKGTAA